MLLCWLIRILAGLPNQYNATVFMNPLFICSHSIPTESFACQHLDVCFIANDFTGTYSADLICDNRQMRMNIQAMQGIGAIIGMTGFSMLADRKGRKYAFLASLYTIISALFCIFFGILAKNYFLMGIGQFLSGSSCLFCLPIGYTIAKELFNDQNRQRTILLLCSGT